MVKNSKLNPFNLGLAFTENGKCFPQAREFCAGTTLRHHRHSLVQHGKDITFPSLGIYVASLVFVFERTWRLLCNPQQILMGGYGYLGWCVLAQSIMEEKMMMDVDQWRQRYCAGVSSGESVVRQRTTEVEIESYFELVENSQKPR